MILKGGILLLFSSLSFLFYFIPSLLILYFISPKPLKNPVLLIFSLIFYGWGEPKYVFLMIATIIIGYASGLLIEKYRGKILSKVFLIASSIVILSFLLYFKYANFFIENFSRVTGINIKALNIVLPIGISFYTFQILSYVIDVYRGNVRSQKNPLTLATYVALFPQLIAGPIVRYSDVEAQLLKREHSFEKISTGIRRFICGLSKKIIIANTLGELCQAFYASDDKSVLFFWLYAFSYMLQIYFDFSGYSDMAIGLGKIFGFDFMENFNYPFISSSISEFWRRWHISLGSWFRDYVYIPMGGSRCSGKKLIINILTVWFLTGFWHGAAWNFIIWGLFFAVLLTVEKLWLKDWLKSAPVTGRIYTLFFIIISFVIFSGESAKDIFMKLEGMFGISDTPFISKEFLYYFKSYSGTLLIALIGATPLFETFRKYMYRKKHSSLIMESAEIPVLLVLLFLCVSYLVDGSFNPFLYFRF